MANDQIAQGNGTPSGANLSGWSSDPAGGGREYGKEFLAFAGKWLKLAGRQLNALFIRATTKIPKRVFNGINTESLDKRMAKINWNKDYFSPGAIRKGLGKASFERNSMRANNVLRDLKILTDGGHYMAEELRWKLQRKYWTNTPMQAERGNTLNAISPPGARPMLENPATVKKIRGTSPENSIDTAQGQDNARRNRVALAAAKGVQSLDKNRNKGKHI